MSQSKLSEAVKRGIVARILSGRSTSAKEARAYGQKPATVRGWVSEKRGEMEREVKPITTPATTPADTTGHDGGVASPSETAPGAPSADPDLAARARAAAGLPPSGATPPQAAIYSEEALRIADEEDRKLVVETYRNMKKGLIMAFAVKVGLSVEDSLLAPACEVSALQKTILEANAGMLAPMIRGKLQGWVPLLVGTVFDGAMTLLALREVLLVLVKREEEARKKAEAA